MEFGGNSGGLRSGEESPVRRRRIDNVKRALALERVYLESNYLAPMRMMELAVNLGLTEGQVTAWFNDWQQKERIDQQGRRQQRMEGVGCNTGPFSEYRDGESSQAVGGAPSNLSQIRSNLNANRYYQMPSQVMVPMVPIRPALMIPMVPVVPVRAPMPQPTPAVTPDQVVRHVEGPLGHPTGADGPPMGTEFDPLPRGAFGRATAVVGEGNQPRESSDNRLSDELRLDLFKDKNQNGSCFLSIDSLKNKVSTSTTLTLSIGQIPFLKQEVARSYSSQGLFPNEAIQHRSEHALSLYSVAHGNAQPNSSCWHVATVPQFDNPPAQVVPSNWRNSSEGNAFFVGTGDKREVQRRIDAAECAYALRPVDAAMHACEPSIGDKDPMTVGEPKNRFPLEHLPIAEIENEALQRQEALSKPEASNLMDTSTQVATRHVELIDDQVSTFPPRAVLLKRPFEIPPWSTSDENIGNLLMIWRFFITFADALNLEKFTLDELVQCLHDSNSRLLGTLHIALLKTIIEDIEGAVTRPDLFVGSKVNDGSHPCHYTGITEGVSSVLQGNPWGFEIRFWKSHLNHLTWPEVLRQFSLSAGFGPSVKKRGTGVNNEVHVSCQGMTPGTIRFAAFIVLSFEGSEGLSVVEITEKIQEYGLKDFSDTKKPESSVSSTLSRDEHFVRVGPSRYSVKPAFWKNPAYGNMILSSLGEKIKDSQYWLSELDCAKKDKEEADCAENFEDPKFDSADIICSKQEGRRKKKKAEKVSADKEDLEVLNDKVATSVKAYSDKNLDDKNFGELWVQGLTKGDYFDLGVEDRLNALVALVHVANEGNLIRSSIAGCLVKSDALEGQDWDGTEVNSSSIEPGSEGNHQLSSLNGIVDQEMLKDGVTAGSHTFLHGTDERFNDGSMIPGPNLKFLVSNQNSASQSLSQILLPRETSTQLHPYAHADENSHLWLMSYVGQNENYKHKFLPLGLDRQHNRYWQFSAFSSPDDPGSGRIFIESAEGIWQIIDTEEAFDALLVALDKRSESEHFLHSELQKIEQTFKEATKKKRSQAKLVKSAESNRNDTTETATNHDCTTGLDRVSSRSFDLTSDEMEHSSSFRIEVNHGDESGTSRGYHDFNKWLWNECYSPNLLSAMKCKSKRCSELLKTCKICFFSYIVDQNHCPFCHETFYAFDADMDFSEHLIHCEKQNHVKFDTPIPSLRIQVSLLMALLAQIEVSVPAEALKPFWNEDQRIQWIVKLQSSTLPEDLFQVLSLLEYGIKSDFMYSSFMTTVELINFRTGSLSWTHDHSVSIPPFLWVPNTIASVALRIFYLDSSIPYAWAWLKMKRRSSGPALASNELLPVSMEVPDQVCYSELPRLSDHDGPHGRGFNCQNRGWQELTEAPDQSNYVAGNVWANQGNNLRGRWVRRRGRGRGRQRGQNSHGRGQMENQTDIQQVFDADNVQQVMGTPGRCQPPGWGRSQVRGGGQSLKGQASAEPGSEMQQLVDVVVNAEQDTVVGLLDNLRQDASQEDFRNANVQNDDRKGKRKIDGVVPDMYDGYNEGSCSGSVKTLKSMEVIEIEDSE